MTLKVTNNQYGPASTAILVIAGLLVAIRTCYIGSRFAFSVFLLLHYLLLYYLLLYICTVYMYVLITSTTTTTSIMMYVKLKVA